MKVILVLILLEIFSIITGRQPVTKEVILASLASAFTYDFSRVPSIGEVIIWQLTEDATTFKPQIYYQGSNPKFESNKTYLLFVQNQPKRFCTYYWVGSTASLEAKKAAAQNTFLLYIFLKECIADIEKIVIAREEEFIESESFHNTINFVDKMIVTNDLNTYHKYVDEHLPSKLPNLYVVRGDRTTRIKAVPMGTQWFISDACLILEVGYKVEEFLPVAYLCGQTASYNSSLRAARIAVSLYRPKSNELQVDGRRAIGAFVEILENSDYYRLHEVDDSNDHLKDADKFVADRDRNVSFHTIYQNNMTRRHLKPTEVFSTLFFRNQITNTCRTHLFDSASIAGLFLYMYVIADNMEKLKGLLMAEEYLHNNYSLASKPTRMRIKEIHFSSDIHLDLSINFVNFPIIRVAG